MSNFTVPRFTISTPQPQYFDDLREAARTAYPSLLEIIFVDPDDPGWMKHAAIEEVLEQRGHPGYQGIKTQLAEGSEDYYDGTNDHPPPGVVRLVAGPDGTPRTVIVQYGMPLRAKNPELTAELRWTMDLAVFLHEVGHVDDFEKGINIFAGLPFDGCATELYAHIFAVHEMIKANLLASIAYYLEFHLPRTRAANAQTVNRAIDLFEMRAEYDEARRLAGSRLTMMRNIYSQYAIDHPLPQGGTS